METNKPKQLPYDESEFWRNILRILVIVLYAPTTILLWRVGLEDGREFLHSFGDWPATRYFFFFAPLILSLIDLRQAGIANKNGDPMPSYTRNFMYGSWLVSLAFYALMITALFS
jgi:hypothetical protein